MPIVPKQQADGSWIWVDSATGEPATATGPTQQTTNPAGQTVTTGPSYQVPTAPNIGAPQGAGGMFTVDQTTEQTSKEVQQANVNVTQIWSQIQSAQKDY